jgi:hypothetical protein
LSWFLACSDLAVQVLSVPAGGVPDRTPVGTIVPGQSPFFTGSALDVYEITTSAGTDSSFTLLASLLLDEVT